MTDAFAFPGLVADLSEMIRQAGLAGPLEPINPVTMIPALLAELAERRAQDGTQPDSRTPKIVDIRFDAGESVPELIRYEGSIEFDPCCDFVHHGLFPRSATDSKGRHIGTWMVFGPDRDLTLQLDVEAINRIAFP